MAKAALQEEFTFPEGGIGDFYMEDDEIAALEREEAKKAFGNEGVANFSDVANRMASYGRGGDDTLAHVATGEIVIPLPLIANNPDMKASIFKHLEELGVEDPEQYVVGSSANSINPETGLREFGWLKKTLRKVRRAVKKVAKKVVNVVKKAAPVIIPFVLNAAFPGLGAIYSGAVGAGIGTLVQGGSIEDALKSALVGGAIGGATAGISGGLNAAPGQSFSQGAVSGIKNAAKLSNLSTAGQQLASGQFGQAGLDKVLAEQAVSAPVTASETLAKAQDLQLASADSLPPGTEIPTTDAVVGQSDAGQFLQNQAQAADAVSMSGYGPDPQAMGSTPAGVGDQSAMLTSGVSDSTLANVQTGSTLSGGTAPYESKSFFENIAQGEYGEAFLPSGPTPEQVNLAKTQAYTDTLATYGATPATASAAQQTAAAAEAAKVTAASMGPGYLAKFGPAAAAAGTAAYALGAFDKPDDPPVEDPRTGADEIRDNPDEYLLPGETPTGSTGQTVVGTNYRFDPRAYQPYNPFRRPQFRTQRVAEGGEIFPRRVGGIMPNEGTPGKDSVRAMLMPGEFVMTTDAVKGLGNGNNEQGIRNMYDMMRGLEAKGRSMA